MAEILAALLSVIATLLSGGWYLAHRRALEAEAENHELISREIGKKVDEIHDEHWGAINRDTDDIDLVEWLAKHGAGRDEPEDTKN